MLDLSGTTRGEIGRLWIFLMPFPVIFALPYLRTYWQRVALLAMLTTGAIVLGYALRAKYEFVDDLYFELKVYGSYDSQPPLADSEQSDYGLTTSLGYSF